MPGTIVGARLGRKVYRRLDTAFSKLVLLLLLAGGLGIIAANLRPMFPFVC